MITLRYVLPFTYMIHSRISAPREQIILIFNEICPNLLLLYFLTGLNAASVFRSYFLAYAAFAAIYEIGYFANDFVAVRKDPKPHIRLRGLNPSRSMVAVWIVARISAFAGLSHALGFFLCPIWLAFYITLAIYLFLHNWLTSRYLKTLTYFCLAFMRIIAPTFMFLSAEQLGVILPALLACHVLFRTISYMDGKGILDLPERGVNSSRVRFFLLMMGFNIFWAILINSKAPVLLGGYYLVEVAAFTIASRWWGSNYSPHAAALTGQEESRHGQH